MTEVGTHSYANQTVTPKPRLWIGAVILLLLWSIRTAAELLFPGRMERFLTLIYAPVVGFLATLIWWVGFGRFSRFNRIWVPVYFFVCLGLFWFLKHPSTKLVFAYYVLLSLVTFWLIFTLLFGRDQSSRFLSRGLLVGFIVILGAWCLCRFEGLNGAANVELAWRWGQTAEQRFMAGLRNDANGATPGAALISASSGDFTGFRGAFRDGRISGQNIRTDWDKTPPKQIWKHRIGPGWGSMAVIGDRLYTQEQRAEKEAVVCYSAETGKQIWIHEDGTRFDEEIAGAGPRATPTFDDGKIYAFGAKGILNCLDAATGSVIWTRNISKEFEVEPQMWGFCASPLVTHGLVTVITGKPGKSVAAFNAKTGQPAWAVGDGWSYGSTHFAKIDGVELIITITADGMFANDPTTGKAIWDYKWSMPTGANRVVQPAILDGNDLLIGGAFGVGTRRIHFSRNGEKWNTGDLWTTRKFNPYYNDFVIHNGHLYGFDNTVFACVNLDKGVGKWRSHDYGAGQVLLLADQDVLIIAAETGEVALVDAKPDAHHEIGRFQAIEGKTWNHPVVAHGKLFVRNGTEIAAYDVRK